METPAAPPDRPAPRPASLDDVHRLARARTERDGPLPLAVAAAGDPSVLGAVARAAEAGYVRPRLFGDEAAIRRHAAEAGLAEEGLVVEAAPDRAAAGRGAVRAVSGGDCALLMKGALPTSLLMREVLDREHGLRGGGKMSHVLAIDAPGFERLLFMSDGALNIDPDLALKLEITRNAVAVARRLGVPLPKVALLAAIETVDVQQQASVDTAIIAKMADRGQIRGALVDGPLALDNAVDPHAARVKGIRSEVAGEADVLIVDNIDVGNVLYKSLVYFARARVAGVIAGARAPIVLASRSDDAATKFDSIALGCALA